MNVTGVQFGELKIDVNVEYSLDEMREIISNQNGMIKGIKNMISEIKNIVDRELNTREYLEKGFLWVMRGEQLNEQYEKLTRDIQVRRADANFELKEKGYLLADSGYVIKKENPPKPDKKGKKEDKKEDDCSCQD